MEYDEFEWDDAAAEANLVKHEVSFLDAAGVFEDPFALAHRDPGRAGDAERLRITGAVEGEILTVACAERGARIHIISARRAIHYERRTYHQG